MMNRGFIYFIFIFLLVSCTKYDVVFDAEANREFELTLILNLNDKDCAFDAENGTLKFSLDESSLNGFNPFVKFQEYSRIWLEGRELNNNAYNSFGDLDYNLPLDLRIETEGEVSNFQLLFTSIPIVQIVTLDEIRNEPKILGKLTLNYPDPLTPKNKSFVGIEIRGRTTASFAKKSYGFTPLNAKEVGDLKSEQYFDFSSNYKWALDAMFRDQLRMRNSWCFDIWNSLDHTSINGQFVEVYLNNSSLGLYRFSEVYTEEYLMVSDQAKMFVGFDNSSVTKFEELPNQDPNSAIWGEWEQILPDPKETIDWTDFKTLSELIVEATDQEFFDQIDDQIDLDIVMDYYLFVNLVYGYDNTGKNWYFLKRNSGSNFEILPWDLDATWGRNATGGQIEPVGLIDNNLFDRLLQSPTFRDELKQRWETYRFEQFSESSLINLLDIHLNELENHQIISVENEIWGQGLNLDNEKNYVVSWLQDRLQFLDNYYEGL